MADTEDQSQSVEGILTNFTVVAENPSHIAPKLGAEEKSNIQKIKDDDFGGRIKLRRVVAYYLIGLLIGQNLLVIGLVYYALHLGQLQNLQTIFSVLTTATLIETGFSIKNIVEFLFKEIPYPEQ